MGGKSNTPPAPDYMGLAQQQTTAQQNLTQQQTTANRPNQATPWGSLDWTHSGTGPNETWASTETLNPLEQATLTGQQTGQEAGVQAAGNLFNSAPGMGTPYDFSKGPQVQGGNYYNTDASNAVWDEFKGMEQPLQAQQTQSQQAQLEAQGLRPGDPGYDTSMRNLSNTQFQQTQNAEDQAVLAGEQEAQTMQGMDVQAQNQFINEQEAQKTGNINLWNSLMGNNVTPLQTPSFAQAGGVQAPDLMGAAENLYGAEANTTNAQNAASGNLFSGLGQLASSGALAYLAFA